MSPKATMTVEDVFTIKGRGTVLTGHATAEIKAGDIITCGGYDLVTQVTGVERLGMRPFRAEESIGLLVRLPFAQAARGQVWTLRDRWIVDASENLLALFTRSV